MEGDGPAASRPWRPPSDPASRVGLAKPHETALLLGLVLLAYATAWTASFQWDDFRVIVEEPAVHSLRAWLLEGTRGLRPLLKLSYALDWGSGLGAPGFHGTNLAIHGMNTLLVLHLARRLGLPGALGAAAFFALHPVQTEAVTYVCGRSVSLMNTFYLAALLLHLRAEGPGQGVRRWLGIPGWFAAALLVRETALTLPLAILLVDRFRGRSWGEGFRNAAPCLGLGALVLAAGAFHPAYRGFMLGNLALRDVGSTLATQVQGWSYLALRIFEPWALNLDPDLRPIGLLGAPTILAVVLGLGLLVAAWRRLGFQAPAAFAVLWFALHLLPTNSLVPRLDVASERHLYLPMAGVALAAGSGLATWARGRSRPWIAAGLLLLLGGLTVLRNGDYETEVSLWEDTARKSPAKARVHTNLGFAYQQAGRREDARRAYLRALELDPAYPPARQNLESLEGARP